MSVRLQVTYVNGPTLMHGTDMGEPLPAGAIQLEDCEHIVGIFGASESLVNSIAFNTSQGRVYGPWGSTNGDAFAYTGVVYGLFGGEKWGCIGAVGVWVALSPAPPRPPSPLSPLSPPLPTRGMSKSPLFGARSGVSTTWDDGPYHAGQPPAYPEKCT
jgi:hypothetical protein